MNESPKPNETIEVVKGIGVSILLHVLQYLMTIIFSPVLFAFIGVSQLIYQLPAFYYLRSIGRTGMAKGILIGAALTFLLNAACFGILVATFN